MTLSRGERDEKYFVCFESLQWLLETETKCWIRSNSRRRKEKWWKMIGRERKNQEPKKGEPMIGTIFVNLQFQVVIKRRFRMNSWISCNYHRIQSSSIWIFLFLRYGDESSADDKDDEVKEPDHRNESLQSLVENTRFSIISQLHC